MPNRVHFHVLDRVSIITVCLSLKGQLQKHKLSCSTLEVEVVPKIALANLIWSITSFTPSKMSASGGWHCPICLGSFERPVLASCCGQSFCRSCLDGALRQVDACPMCRSPLLSGPFSVTPNRALEEALAALASGSPRGSAATAQEATSFVDAVERKLTAPARNSASEVRISVPNRAENDNRDVPLIHHEEQQPRREPIGSRWGQTLGLWRCVHCRGLGRCRAEIGAKSAVTAAGYAAWQVVNVEQ